MDTLCHAARACSASAVADALDDHLYALNADETRYPKAPRAYLEDWAATDADWQLIRARLGALRVGAPISCGALHLVPLLGPDLENRVHPGITCGS